MNAVPWDPLQREVLEAMGFAVYRAAMPAATPAMMPMQAAQPAATLPISSHDASANGPLPDDPLISALLRAAGRDRDAGDAAQLVRGWPAPQALRRDPRAKRALWPQLRALRRPRA